jgi:hypothetical protein
MPPPPLHCMKPCLGWEAGPLQAASPVLVHIWVERSKAGLSVLLKDQEKQIVTCPRDSPEPLQVMVNFVK